MSRADDTHVDLARSRSAGYGVLAKLVLRGLDEGLLAVVAGLPGLAESLPDDVDLDELAAEHYDLFHMESTPYAAEYGTTADDVLASFVAGGFTPRLEDARPDHLGVLLGHLAFLAGAHADALEDGAAQPAQRVAEITARFIDRHLARWLPCYLASALDRTPGFWTAVLTMAWDVASEHRQQLPRTDEGVELAATGLDLEAARTGLRDVAEFLSRPARCGVYISRGDITEVARQACSPRGFGARRLMLENLLHSSADYGESTQVITALSELVARRGAALLEHAGGRVAAPLLTPWLARIDQTLSVLRTIESASATATTPPCTDTSAEAP